MKTVNSLHTQLETLMLEKIINGESPRSALLKLAAIFKKPVLKKSSYVDDKKVTHKKAFYLHNVIQKGSNFYTLLRSNENPDAVLIVCFSEKLMAFNIVSSMGTDDYSCALALAKKQLRDMVTKKPVAKTVKPKADVKTIAEPVAVATKPLAKRKAKATISREK